MNEQTVVLVTGALSGIGRAAALAFARSRARVVISGRRADEGRALADTLRSLGAEVEFLKADVRIEHLARDEARGCRTKDARFP